MNREIVGGGGASIYPLQGDVESTAGSSTVTVVGLQTIPVAVSFPSGGEVLTYDGPTNTLLLEAPAQQVSFETNGTLNSIQDLLNLAAGTNISLSESAGIVTISSTGGGGGGFTTKNNFNVTGRSFGNPFTNSSGGTRMVSCSAELVGGTGGDFKIQAITGGVAVQSATGSSTITGSSTMGVSFMVLSGEVYQVNVTDLSGSGVYGVGEWTEWE